MEQDKIKDPKRVATGKKNRASGRAFELKVRKHLEISNTNVLKNSNNVELEPIAKLVPCKPKYNPFTKGMMMISGGFPDFIVYRPVISDQSKYEITSVEVKSNGTLNKEEKDKCVWLLEHKIFNKILIARKGEKRGQIIYEEFKYAKTI
jgi:hypothetical protein